MRLRVCWLSPCSVFRRSSKLTFEPSQSLVNQCLMKNLRCNSLDQHILYDLPWERNQQKSPRKPFNPELPENLLWQNASICYIPERKLRHAACNLLFLKTSTLRSQYQICLPVLVGQPIPLSVHKLPFFQAISRVHCQILKFASES